MKKLGAVSLKADLNVLDTMNEFADLARLCFGISSLSRIKLIKCAKDAEYLVEDSKTGLRALLYITGPDSGKERLELGMHWMQELSKETNLLIPEPLLGLSGSYIQPLSVPYLNTVRYCVMYSVSRVSIGTSFDPDGLGAVYTKLGETAAMLHQNGMQWGGAGLKVHPAASAETMLENTRPPVLTALPEYDSLFSDTLRLIDARLKAFGKSLGRYGLIHGNLDTDSISTVRSRTAIHDFFQCGYSWFLYDCAPALAPVMHLPAVTDLTVRWIEGYKKRRHLSSEDIAEIPTFLILHRLVLLDQLITQPVYDPRKISAPDFTETTAALCESYLTTHA